MFVAASAREARGLISRAAGALTRISTALALLAYCLVAVAVPAEAGPRFSVIAVDARSGRVLFAREADGVCHPASLTKVMTLYVLFQEMAAGRMTRDTRLTISKYAASREPSKLGLKPGATIRLDDAIRAVVTKSANDMAAAIAEGVSGSESAFADRMTRTARAIGMTRSTFRNASGLPNPQQVTTARDMATLGLRIQRDFPQYYGYFSLRSFAFNGRSFRNHNRLLGKFKGMDGIKTGYIRASGFNLITSAERDGKRLVGVVMGGKSPNARNQYMATMLETQFAKASFARGGSIAAAAGDPPGYIRNQVSEDTSRRSAARGKAELATDTDDLATAKRRIAELQAAIAEAELKSAAHRASKTTAKHDVGKQAAEKLRIARLTVATQLAAKHAVRADPAEMLGLLNKEPSVRAETLNEPVSEESETKAKGNLASTLADENEAASARTFASVVPAEAQAETTSGDDLRPALAKGDNLAAVSAPQAEVTPSAGTWNIQIGAFPSKDGAERRIEETRALGVDALTGKSAFTMSIQIGSETYFRARFSGFTESDARDACKSLAAKGFSCFALSPQG